MLGAGWRNAKLCSEKPPHGLITVRSRNSSCPADSNFDNTVLRHSFPLPTRRTLPPRSRFRTVRRSTCPYLGEEASPYRNLQSFGQPRSVMKEFANLISTR